MTELNFTDLITQKLELCKYCNSPCDSYNKPALKCSGKCNTKVHLVCLKSQGVPSSIVGDVFFEFICMECNSSMEESIIREKLSWLAIIILTLHHLREKSIGISRFGYFHRTANICTFIAKNWDSFFTKGTKPKKQWKGTVSGALSLYKHTFFKSGTLSLKQGGWWKLRYHHPPEILMAMNTKMILERKNRGIDVRELLPNASPHSVAESESSLSCGDDSNGGGEGSSRVQTPSMFSREYVQPTEMLSDFLFADDDIPEIDLLNIDNNIDFNDESFVEYKTDQDCPLLFSSNDSMVNNFTDKFTSKHINESGDTVMVDYDAGETSNDSTDLTREPVPSLFTTTPRREWPWKRKNCLTRRNKPPMSKHEEEYLLRSVTKPNLDSLLPLTRRFYRKLAIRKAKRDNNLPLFDFNYKLGAAEKIDKGEKRVIDRFVNDHLNTIFEQRLQGYCEPTAVHSPYTNRLLKPFIRRDNNCRPPWLRVIEELRAKVNRIRPNWQPEPLAPIDYCYVRPQQIPAINGLCSQFFWPGIDGKC